jgi:hypothetical protein
MKSALRIYGDNHSNAISFSFANMRFLREANMAGNALQNPLRKRRNYNYPLHLLEPQKE